MGSVAKCSRCTVEFYKMGDLERHRKECSGARKKRDPHAFTVESSGHEPIKTITFSETVPDTVLSLGSKKKSTKTAASATVTRDTLLGAMESAMKKPVKTRKSGVETSILTAIAEGDDELASAYEKLSIDPTTGAKRLTKEIVEAVSARSKIDVNKLATMLSRAQAVSLCFLVDTTGSMGPYISGVKDQIIDMVRQIHASGCKIVGLAFVGYKDWCDGEDHFEILNFAKSIDAFTNFVISIRATGGGDAPEDVIGGISKAVALDWPSSSSTRVIFHLGDAPPHGRPKYHSDMADSYPEGHPSDKPLDDLFREIREKNINYFFGRINNYCDSMIKIFETHYGRKVDSFDSKSVSTLCGSVVTAVAKSVSTSSDESVSSARLSHLKLRKYVLDEKEPDWTKLPFLEGTILNFKLPESIEAITSFEKLEEKIYKCKLQIAPNPFAKGSVRLAYYGKVRGDHVDDVVFKEIIALSKVEELDRQRYMTDLEVQTIAAKLAFEFNKQLAKTSRNPNIRLKFLMAKVVRIALSDGTCRFMAYEKRFRGATPELIKYTNNLCYVLNMDTLDEEGKKHLKLAVAFSHFSHHITDGYLLVCDLQGISTVDRKGKPTLLLTDPAIHCPTHLRFGKTNLQDVGITQFFEKHVCNELCHALGLTKPTLK